MRALDDPAPSPGAQALARALGYRKFVDPASCRVLILHSGYHLQSECARALTALGHHVAVVKIGDLDCPAVVRALLTQLVAHRPDFVLAINHLGFDDQGQVGNILEACEVPIACWYCDSPLFVLRGGALPAPKMTSLFVWERTLMPTLKALGAQDVHHLPLGCDLTRFSQEPSTGADNAYPLAFVGHSMREACRTWTARLSHTDQMFANTVMTKLENAPRDPVCAWVRKTQIERPELHAWDALGAATFRATASLRDSLLRALPPSQLHVFGDAEWHGVLDGPVTLHGPVTYGLPLAQVYNAATINLNATSLQMPTAVNQRIFDVPAAGGFLLSDAQADVQDLFELNEEAVVYSNKDELAHLSTYYLSRPQARARVVARAQMRIRRCHTYAHRLTHLVATMRQRYS